MNHQDQYAFHGQAGYAGLGIQNARPYDPDPIRVAKERLQNIEHQLARVPELEREAEKLRRIIRAAEEP